MCHIDVINCNSAEYSAQAKHVPNEIEKGV